MARPGATEGLPRAAQEFHSQRRRRCVVAGAHFRRLYQAKREQADEATIERLRQAYRKAQREIDALSPRDEAAIQAVLARRV